jgi:chromosome partitioning protein
MVGDIDIVDTLVQTEIANLHLIPSHINLVGAEIEMLEDENRESVLKTKLSAIQNNYDYIIIDCSPSLGLITVNCLTAANSVIIPVQPEFFALEGLGKLLQTIRLVQGKPNPGLTIEGFVVTMFDGRTKVHNQVLGELREHFGAMVFNTIIQRNIRLSEAPSHGKPIILYDVICNGTTNYLNLAKEVLERNSQLNNNQL